MTGEEEVRFTHTMNTMSVKSLTFRSFLELLAAFLLPPLPWLEDLAKGRELALTLWGTVPHAAPFSHHCALVLLSFII